MIIGIGVDSIEIARVATTLEGNDKLLRRLFTHREIDQVPTGPKAFSRLAALFAGKEAVLKALGTGLAGHNWQQVEILHGETGAPRVYLHGQAESTAKDRGIEEIHISLTHDRERAMAYCIAEGIR